ncbi:22256_t:CDS:2, partial [Cetraspora pellucida]
MIFELKNLSLRSLEPALIFHHRIESNLWTGEEEKEVKIFYDAIKDALKDVSLEEQRKQKLLFLQKTPPEIKRILRGKCSDEEHDAYQDIYNTLEELVLKLNDDNDYDSLHMEVIDITSKWASKFKDTTVNFAKGVFSKKLELEEDLVKECKKVIQETQSNTNLKWIISESSIVSLGHWWKLSIDWNKNQSERNFLTQVIEPLLSVALYDLPVDVTYELKGELQSRANQDYKSRNTKTSAIGDRPDIMFTVKISEKALELLYIESGRCITTEKKVSSDHTKLIRLCKSGYNFVTTQKRLKDNKEICSFLTILGINITGKHMKIYGLQRKNNIYFYFPIVEADIPVRQTAWENVHELVYALLLVR